jgi:hypothetical protein
LIDVYRKKVEMQDMKPNGIWRRARDGASTTRIGQAMPTGIPDVVLADGRRWRKSVRSAGGNCIEIMPLSTVGVVMVRDSKDPEGPVLRYTQAEWEAFLRGAKSGEFDDTLSTAGETGGLSVDVNGSPAKIGQGKHR